jgi:hypothetical protein
VDASRARMILGSAVAVGLLGTILVAPVAAAECALTAPAFGRVGSVLAVNGTGFPASATIDIALTVEGGNPDEFSVQSDPSGEFEITLTPEAIDEGETTVTASAGSTCTAQVTFDILGENEPAPTTEPTVGPTSEPTGEAAGAAASSGPDAPRTDVVLGSDANAERDPGAWLGGGLVLIMLGVVGLVASRPVGGRLDR